MTTRASGKAVGPGGKKIRLKRHQKELLFMLLPGFLFFLIYKYFPMYGVLIAFKNFRIKKGILGSPWADPLMKNFDSFFKSPYCNQVLRNTVVISLLKVVIGTLSCILLAVLISEVRNQRFKRVVQTATYLPHFLSWVVIYGVIYAIVSESSGLINVMRRAAGQRTIPILTSTTLFTPMLFFTDVWKNAGWGAIVYLAAIAGIDPGLYEAASIDGAGRWKKMQYVTFPALGNTIITVLILNLAKIMNLFESVFA